MEHSGFGDARDNAAIIFQCSNVCPFKFKNNSFYCAYCPFQAPDFVPVRIHTLEHQDNIPKLLVESLFQGTKCEPFLFKADVTNLTCNLCQQSVNNLNTLCEHLIEVHKKPLVRKYGPGILPHILNDMFTCADCGQTFDRYVNLSRHVRIHYATFLCSHCGESYSTRVSYEQHLLVHNKKKTPMKCSQCEEIFSSHSKRRMHMSNVHNHFINKCPYCDETFKFYHGKLNHLNSVHGKEIYYKCTSCDKSFKTQSAKRRHVRRIHLKEKNFVCTVCSDAYFSSVELKDHMITHTRERIYKCEVCSKAYLRKKTLTEHMRIHSHDNKYVCRHCNSAFVQKCSLTNHMKNHHSDLEEMGRARELT